MFITLGQSDIGGYTSAKGSKPKPSPGATDAIGAQE
jgi:hypothetical protein